ncbi:Hypothetical protein BN69_1024 [Methylocystis sp. SC2]|nr:Hypothetical protein BN69_1024 [Methylocystis sp. SC2]
MNWGGRLARVARRLSGAATNAEPRERARSGDRPYRGGDRRDRASSMSATAHSKAFAQSYRGSLAICAPRCESPSDFDFFRFQSLRARRGSLPAANGR